MKIALLNTLYAPYQTGGAERAVQELAEGLVRRGHLVCVITLGEDHLDRCSVIDGVTVHRVPLANWYWPYSGSPGNAAARAAWKLRDFHNPAMSAHVGRVLDRERPDVLLTNALGGFSVGVWHEAARRRIPVAHTLHDYYLMCPPGAMYRNGANCEGLCARCVPFAVYRAWASRTVAAVIGVSGFILERHLGAGLFAGRRSANVIFNALPVARRDAPARDATGPLVFGFIGRLSAEKGIQWLLEVFAASAQAGERLVVAGKGEKGFTESLRARFASPAITFLGHVDPDVFYRQVDVVVVPSLWNEPFGKTAIEPLAYGIPVIATRRGGLPEIVDDGVTGILVEPHESDSLARAMRRLSGDRELARRLGANAARSASRFSERAYIDAYLSVSSDLVNHAGIAALAGAPAARIKP